MPNRSNKITRYLGVSELVCDTFEEMTGNKTELAYNPIEIKKPKKVLNLISATRLTAEKGRGRMINPRGKENIYARLWILQHKSSEDTFENGIFVLFVWNVM